MHEQGVRRDVVGTQRLIIEASRVGVLWIEQAAIENHIAPDVVQAPGTQFAYQ